MEKKRDFMALDRKSPPFAEKREGWGTLGELTAISYQLSVFSFQTEENPGMKRRELWHAIVRAHPSPKASEGWGTLKFKG